MHKYKLLGKKGEGTFSEVLKAQDIKSNKFVAIKCMKNHFDNVDHVNRLREIQALRRLSPHPNIVKLYEVLYDRSTGRLALVFELMEMNIYELIKGRKRYLAEDKVLHYMYQLVKSIDHMHKNGIFHRDIKPENILILGDALKLADFGSCRGIYSKQPFTEYISTRWYRAPECLLTDGYYNFKMDIWGVGCVFFEVMSLYPLFPGENELDQIHKVHNIIGTPAPDVLMKLKRHGTHMDFDFPAKAGTGIAKLVPHASADALDLMLKMMAYNADDRITAKQALRHAYFREIRELDKKLRRAQQKAALGADGNPSGAGGANGKDDDDDDDDNGTDIQDPTSANAGQQQPSSNSGNANGNTKLPTIGGSGANSGAKVGIDSGRLPSIVAGGANTNNNNINTTTTTNNNNTTTSARTNNGGGSNDINNNSLMSSSIVANANSSNNSQQQQQTGSSDSKKVLPKLVPLGKQK
jgi:renal tumor antigen